MSLIVHHPTRKQVWFFVRGGPLFAVVLATAGLLFCFGIWFASLTLPLTAAIPEHASNLKNLKELQAVIQADEMEMGLLRQEVSTNLAQVQKRVRQLESKLAQVERLGQRLLHQARLPLVEFQEASAENVAHLSPEPFAADIFVQVQDLQKRLLDRAAQLSSLERRLARDKHLQEMELKRGQLPVVGPISSAFGWRRDPILGTLGWHGGIDFVGPLGTAVQAVASGVVTFAGMRRYYGQVVELSHGEGFSSLYAHNEELLVQVGQIVRKGSVLARMGKTGRTTGVHLHFEIRQFGKAVDPAGVMRLLATRRDPLR